VVKDGVHGLQELGLASGPLLGRVPLGGEFRTDVLEAGAEEVVLVAVVGVEGGAADVGPVEDVLDGTVASAATASWQRD
jgi:hypothetical protein